jgi:hypothetical protein
MPPSPKWHCPRCVKLEKKNFVIDGPPPFWFQMCSSSLKPMQIPAMLRHGGNLRLWRDIGRFSVSWGDIEISPNNRSTGIGKKSRQLWTSPQQRWTHQFLARRAHVNHPNFIAQHSTPRECDGATRTRRADFFSQKLSPGCRILIPAIRPWRWLVSRRSFVLYTRSSQARP